jgi:hypothetical protein
MIILMTLIRIKVMVMTMNIKTTITKPIATLENLIITGNYLGEDGWSCPCNRSGRPIGL